jgi:hypothetical protein
MILSKKSIKQIFDYLPLAILMFYAIRLPITLQRSNIPIVWINVTGYIFLTFTVLLFVRRHQFGVLALGLLLLLGLFGGSSFSPGISSFSFGLGHPESRYGFTLYGDPAYILYLTLHFILSGRYYVGIATKKYWKALRNDWRPE